MKMMMTYRRASKWRNFLNWGAAGAALFLALRLTASILVDDRPAADLSSEARAWEIGINIAIGLAVAALVGLSRVNRPLDRRTFRNFVMWGGFTTVIAMPLGFAIGGLHRSGRLGTMGPSEWTAFVVGMISICLAMVLAVGLAGARGGVNLLDSDAAYEEVRDRGRYYVLCFVTMAVFGLLLITLSLAVPGGMISAPAALAVAGGLCAMLVALNVAVWRMCDEMDRAMSIEAGNIAFYLSVAIGGGWAMLAHIGHAAGPAPLDWLTLFMVLIYAASVIVVARRKLFPH